MTVKEEGQLIDLSQRPVKTLGCYHSGIWGLKGPTARVVVSLISTNIKRFEAAE
jgi:hypothetical protein